MASSVTSPVSRNCDVCPTPLTQPRTGRPRRYCSGACRQKAHRASPTGPILAANPLRRSNAELIADCAEVGYLDASWLTFDATYGRGTWWRQFRPNRLIHGDYDFRDLPFADESFDAVTLDPPYKLNGTPSLGDFDARYGLDVGYVPVKERHELIRAGISECARVLKRKGFLLLKCQNQVCSRAVVYQVDEFTDHGVTVGLKKVDDPSLLNGGRPQPKGRSQEHFWHNYSTLIVFRKAVSMPRPAMIGGWDQIVAPSPAARRVSQSRRRRHDLSKVVDARDSDAVVQK